MPIAGDSANDRGGDGDSHRGGKKIVARQRHHLREIRHRVFAAVALPIGVGGEAGGGVERQIAGHGGFVGKIVQILMPGQMFLKPRRMP